MSELDPYVPPKEEASSGNDHPQEERKHSKLGVASAILAGVTIVGYVAAIGGSIFLFADTRPGQGPSSSTMTLAMVLGGAMLLCLTLNLVGLILGIVGAAQSGYKKGFAWVGIVVNGMLLLLSCGMMSFGTLANTRTAAPVQANPPVIQPADSVSSSSSN